MSVAPAALAGTVRRRIVVRGIVQGVGFRPFVHRLATSLGLVGFVGNDASGVFVEVEGDVAVLDRFERALRDEAPPLAIVDEVSAVEVATAGDDRFRIVESAAGDAVAWTAVPADVAVCADCLAEVFDPADRRYRHPFANCTNCGPRFTVIRDLPYDRAATTMAGFPMCPACAAEYADPLDRRYHAEPIACPQCGPQLTLVHGSATVTGSDRVLAATQALLAAGRIVAVKGIGGYHLACDAGSAAAVDELRRRKGRADKPFAVMVPTLDVARELCEVDEAEAAALVSPAAPIVLLRRRAGGRVAGDVAPGNPRLGVMLAYTPFHHLLFAPVPESDATPPRVLVMTSGNVSNEPICTDDDDARERLAVLADAFVVHDRPIHLPCDDSVVRIVDGAVQPVRRSRGYAPLPVPLAVDVAPVVASGGELKNTCCVASGRRAWVSQHVGDMENLETLAAFDRGVTALRSMYRIEPVVWATDGHPGYLARRWTYEHAPAGRVVEVQHHHAHVAAAMAEHGLDGTSPVIGVAFDGTGYGIGDDGEPEVWGGEVLVADFRGFRRAAHLRPLPLPGGDAAVVNPCRIAVAYLAALGIDGDTASVRACEPVELALVRRQVERDVGCVPTTSMGRLFDAVASLLDVRHRISYEAQAAIELEALAETGDPGRSTLSFTVDEHGVIDPAPLLRELVDAVAAGIRPADLALAFHRAVADAIVAAVAFAGAATGRVPVVLTGGVFQNALLTRLARRELEVAGFEVLTHRLVPPNDGGLALGQAVVAGLARQRGG